MSINNIIVKIQPTQTKTIRVGAPNAKVVQISTGIPGPSGPNSVTTSTTTNITGLLKGNGSTVAQATAGTDYVTPSQLASYAPAVSVQATYAAMIALGTPTINTFYVITADENKSYVNSTYLWLSNGSRLWIASTGDN